jgi:hypothetical protein
MPRYHFHVQDGRDHPDTDGMELPDIIAARGEAIAGEMLRDLNGRLPVGSPWRMDVTDDAGRSVLILRFTAEAA